MSTLFCSLVPLGPYFQTPSPPSSLAPVPLPIPLPHTIATTIYQELDFLDNSSEPTDDIDSSTVQSNLYNPLHIPNIPVSDRVSSTEPAIKLVTTEFLQKSLGFRNIAKVMKNLTSLAQGSILVRDTGRNPILSRGETTTLPKKNRNKTPVPRPSHFGEVFHYDIGYGNGHANGGIHYVLFIIDRKKQREILLWPQRSQSCLHYSSTQKIHPSNWSISWRDDCRHRFQTHRHCR